jgi:tRNA A-37 threonylcarbamoyl transferase component Bud32
LVAILHTLQALQAGKLSPEYLKSQQLAPITRLQISENLTEFPPQIFELAESLEILDLSNNGLSSLPDDLHRLKKLRVLFLSNNQFNHVPPVLAQCPKLEMIGFKANQISTVAENALPVHTRWLILTDNQIEALPDSMGKLYRLQKLALAGNQLIKLPATMAACKNLELVRLSANQLISLPDWLLQLPKLSWLAFAGNAFNRGLGNSSQSSSAPSVVNVNMEDIELFEKIGEGASGVIYRAKWLNQPASLKGQDPNIAVKLFKGEVTSDGYPADELNCCLSAGSHSSLIKVVAQIAQQDQLGLVMELIPDTFYNLGLPPNFKTCTRDTFKEGTNFTLIEVLKITQKMSATMSHLHRNKVSHGDVYAHNIMRNIRAHVLFGDFGAASNLSFLPAFQKEAIESIEVRALGCLIEDLLGQVNTISQDHEVMQRIIELKNRCMHEIISLRPKFTEVQDVLASMLIQVEDELVS